MTEIITAVIIGSSIFLGFFTTYVLKSRCTRIDCCGCHIERDVIPANQLGNTIPASNINTTQL